MFIKKNALSRGSRAKDFMVKVTSRTNVGLQGEVTHLSSQQTLSFRDLLELIALVHNKLEELGIAVPAMEIRSWPRLTLARKKEERIGMNERNTTRAEFKAGGSSFLIRIIYRQNASWRRKIFQAEFLMHRSASIHSSSISRTGSDSKEVL